MKNFVVTELWKDTGHSFDFSFSKSQTMHAYQSWWRVFIPVIWSRVIKLRSLIEVFPPSLSQSNSFSVALGYEKSYLFSIWFLHCESFKSYEIYMYSSILFKLFMKKLQIIVDSIFSNLCFIFSVLHSSNPEDVFCLLLSLISWPSQIWMSA